MAMLNRSNSTSTTSLYSRNSNRFDPAFPQTEIDHLQVFQDKILASQERSIGPLVDALVRWLNSSLGITSLSAENLVEQLATGVLLCQLAKVIEEKATAASGDNQPLTPVTPTNHVPKAKPKLNGRIHTKARPSSFLARDNIALFLDFCRTQLGINSDLIFETEDLVSGGEMRNVLVCLYEVGRVVRMFGMGGPSLQGLNQKHHKESFPNFKRDMFTENAQSRTVIEKSLSDMALLDSLDSGLHDDFEPAAGTCSQPPLDTGQVNHSAIIQSLHQPLSKEEPFRCTINGRSVLVRICKDKLLVRVGGGWMRLEEFLARSSLRRGSVAVNYVGGGNKR